MGHERLIKATGAHSLKWRDNEEGAVEQVAAIGLASKYERIGAQILHTENLDPKSLRKAIQLARIKLCKQHRLQLHYAERVIQAALFECLRPNCIHCGGNKETFQQNAAVQTCEYCNGTGKHRYSNTERAILIGGKYNQRVYENALDIVRDAIHNIVVRSAKRLGDDQSSTTQVATPTNSISSQRAR